MKNSTLRQTCGILVALAAGVVLGLLLRRAISFGPTANTAVAGETESNPDTNLQRRPQFNSAGMRNGMESGHGHKRAIGELNQMPRTRRALWFAAQVEKAGVSDMPRLMRLAAGDLPVLQMLGARWAELDRQHMFDKLVARIRRGSAPDSEVLLQRLVDDWVKDDPTGVIEALSQTEHGGKRPRDQVINHLMQDDPGLGLMTMLRWNIRDYIPDMDQIASWAAKNPRAAAETVAKMSQFSVANAAINDIATAWAKSDPEAALDFSTALEGKLRGLMVSAVMKHWASEDLDAAIAYATRGADAANRVYLYEGLVVPWAKTDPVGAMHWCHQSLSGTARTAAIASVVKSVAAEDVGAASEFVAAMEPGSVRNAAVSGLFGVWFHHNGEGAREAAIDWLASQTNRRVGQKAIEDLHWSWIGVDPGAVTEFVSGKNGFLATRQMVSETAALQVQKNPEAGVEWAWLLPEDRTHVAREAAMHAWFDLSPDAAMQWASRLPEGERRSWAIASITREMACYGQLESGTRWLKTLSDTDRESARKVIGKLHLKDERRDQLISAIDEER